MATKAAELYDEDFYAWTQQQAQALRAHFQGDNRLDVEHLAEEVEDLGKSELHGVESLVEQIIAHLLKPDYSGQSDPRSHWRAEILNFRQNVARKITPSIRRTVERRLDELYHGGRQIAAAGTLVHEPDLIRRLPKSCPYDWHTIWHRDVLAEGGLHLGESAESDHHRKRGPGSGRPKRALDRGHNKSK
jgi:Domain of unknown function DUF29